MTSTPSSIALHIGAHKTASTHLQRSLSEADLSGVSVIGPPQLRQQGQTLPERFGFPFDESRASTDPVDVSAVLQDLAAGADRLVLSDENYAGRLQTGWGRVPMPIYPTAAKRLALLEKAIRGANGPRPELFLCIRDPADFLTSVYSQVLHGGRRVRPSAFLDKNDPGGVDWVDYVRRLREVEGIGAFTVWRYEDYPQVFDVVCRLLTGHTSTPSFAGRVQKRLSQPALDLLMRAKDARVPLSAIEASKAHPRADGDPGFELYGKAARASSAKSYEAQWVALRQIKGVTALQPE